MEKTYKTIRPINELSEIEKETRENVIEKYTNLESKLDSIMFFQCIITTIVAVVLAVCGFYIAKDSGKVAVFIIGLVIVVAVGLITPPMENLDRKLILAFIKIGTKEYEQLAEDYRKYVTQKSIERFFMQLCNTQKETVNLTITISLNDMVIEWKYADVDTGNVKIEYNDWTVREVVENCKIDTPTIDIKNLQLFIPLQEIEKEEM